MIAPLPHGLPALIQRYGQPLDYVDRQDRWGAITLVRRELPFSLPYAYGPVEVTAIRAHRLIADELVEALWEAHDAGVPVERITYGGCYCWRPQSGNTGKLSTHTWGIAVDLDPANNWRGMVWKDDGKMLHPTLVRVFQARGWKWGNDWDTPDPMHWQAVEGY
jgi:hypothetical protein